MSIDAEPVGARLQTLSARALLTLQLWRTARGALRLGAGAGVDLVRVTPLAGSSETATLAESAWLKLAVARLQARYAQRIASFMELTFAVGADLDLSDTRYVAQRRDGEQSVLDPWPVRPFVALGATVP